MLHNERSWLRSIPTSSALLSLIILLVSTRVSAQSISNLTIPPLQWINLTPLLSGSSAAPPLKDASIGYDEDSRNVIIFGGESSQGFPQANTYLLNLDSLTWRSPSTLPNLAGITPPARSAAISGRDVSANYRRAHIVIGGKGPDGPLQDIWEFDYAAEFWSQVTVDGSQQPSARWGAAGGMDYRTPVITDTFLAWPNNSYFLIGGFDGKSPVPLSDVWRFNVTGPLSSNNINDVYGTWEQISVTTTALGSAAQVGLAGTAVYQGTEQHIVAVGGCNGTSVANDTCADGNSYVVNIDTKGSTSPPACPAPRVGAALAPNMNGGSSAFMQQVFLLLGTFNTSLWDDDGGSEKGEVGVLDINTGAWARVLPAGDPGTTGTPTFPTPREGAAVFSFEEALVGGSRTSASDTIVFGGRDAKGNYLSEVWILRAYNGIVSQSGQHWDGFGDGKLTTGTNATGAGVTVQYMTRCAVALASSPTSSTGSGSTGSTHSPTSTGSQPGPSQTQGSPAPTVTNLYDTSTTHKVLAPVSVALVFPALVLYRLALPSISSAGQARPVAFFYLFGLVALAAEALGIAGLATAFTSLTYTASAIVKRSTPQSLTTAHGRAGLALFIGMYGIVPLLIIAVLFKNRSDNDESNGHGRVRRTSNDIAEKLGLYHHRGASPVSPPPDKADPPASKPQSGTRVRSWGSATLSRFSLGHGRRSSESVVDHESSPSTHSFEVTNRPGRPRRASANSLAAISDPRPSLSPHNLSDMSWLARRRSPGAMGDLDYALTQLNNRPQDPPPTPGTAILDMMSTRGLVNSDIPNHPILPSPFECFVHIVLHAFLLALCALSLDMLFTRAPVAPFAVFLAWSVCFYILIFALAWFGIPRESILSTVLFRLRTPPAHPANGGTATPHPPSSVGLDTVPFPSDGQSPYQHHQPTYRTAHDSEYPTSLSHAGHTMEDYADEDDDEETNQRRIEEEMSRRDVSIVTVPKRKLYLTNPEPS